MCTQVRGTYVPGQVGTAPVGVSIKLNNPFSVFVMTKNTVFKAQTRRSPYKNNSLELVSRTHLVLAQLIFAVSNRQVPVPYLPSVRFTSFHLKNRNQPYRGSSKNVLIQRTAQRITYRYGRYRYLPFTPTEPVFFLTVTALPPRPDLDCKREISTGNGSHEQQSISTTLLNGRSISIFFFFFNRYRYRYRTVPN